MGAKMREMAIFFDKIIEVMSWSNVSNLLAIKNPKAAVDLASDIIVKSKEGELK